MFPETGYLQPHVPAERRLASVWKWQEFKEGMEIKWRQTRHILDSQWRTFRDREEMRRKEWEGEREDWKAYRQELELRWIEVVAGWEGFVEAEEHRFKAWAEAFPPVAAESDYKNNGSPKQHPDRIPSPLLNGRLRRRGRGRNGLRSGDPGEGIYATAGAAAASGQLLFWEIM